MKHSKMKRTLLVVMVLIFSLLATFAQPLEKSLLWEISGKGPGSPSYLYGTFHLLCPDDLVIPDRALAAQP